MGPRPVSLDSLAEAGEAAAAGGAADSYPGVESPTSRGRDGGGPSSKAARMLVDAIRSKSADQLLETFNHLRQADGKVEGVNDCHHVTERTPLHEAVVLGNQELVGILLMNGADPNCGHPTQGTPLLHAAAWGETRIVQLLLNSGASLAKVDSAGYTALHYACSGGHVATARVLMDAGCDTQARTTEGETPLQLARGEDVRALFLRAIGAPGAAADAPVPAPAAASPGGDPALEPPQPIGFPAPALSFGTGSTPRQGVGGEDDAELAAGRVRVSGQLRVEPKTPVKPGGARLEDIMTALSKLQEEEPRAGCCLQSEEEGTRKSTEMGFRTQAASTSRPSSAHKALDGSELLAEADIPLMGTFGSGFKFGVDSTAFTMPEDNSVSTRCTTEPERPSRSAGPHRNPPSRLKISSSGDSAATAPVELHCSPSAGQQLATSRDDADGEAELENSASSVGRAPGGGPVTTLKVLQAAETLARQVGSPKNGLQMQAAHMFSSSVEVCSGDVKWTCGELLGKGAYGKVYAGLNQETGELMAVKVLPLPGDAEDAEGKQKQIESLQQELELYRRLQHRHVVGYIASHLDQAANTMYIFLEYIPGGSISSMIERFGSFSEELGRNYTRQLLLGLEYLHGCRIVHRDLKGGNVLVTRDGRVKLADFGACKAFQDSTITDGMKSIRGSVYWMAPEVIKGTGYGRRADVWSVGCAVVEMLTGKHPWPDLDNHWSAMFAIAKVNDGPPRPSGVSQQCLDFLDQCFRYDPQQRPTASEMLQHPWVARHTSARKAAEATRDLNHSL